MFNTPIFRQILLCISLTLSLASVFLVLNIQSSYSQNPEVSYLDVNDTSSVSKFSVAAWFKTSADYKSDAFIVNKPGSSSNMNYGIWMTDTEKVSGGFETPDGNAVYATSPLSYSDGKWHYVVVTFDGSVINLYVDGVFVGTKKASVSPDMGGVNPVRIGADSGLAEDFFDGNVDEIRVYSVAWTPEQVNDAYHGTFDTKYQELYLDFSDPIAIINATLPINQTSLNQTALNQTSLNQTALNQTSLNQTALNQTSLNQTEPEGNATDMEGNATDTEGNVELAEAQIRNDTGIIEETVGNQSSEPLEEENNSPEAFDQSVSVEQDGQIDITLVATDEDNDPLQFDLTADPLQGSIDQLNNEKGTLTYSPQQGYSGNDEFKFRVVDDKGSQSNIAVVDINVEESEQQSNEKQDNSAAGTTGDIINDQTQTSNQAAVEDQTKKNVSPKADAGDNKEAEVNTEVKLDGSKSSDEDGEIVSYKWDQTDGPKIDLKNSDEKTASFDVPESAADSTLKFKLTVVDDKDASDSDNTSVQIQSVPQVSDQESNTNGESD
jgi:hypothetical protein